MNTTITHDRLSRNFRAGFDGLRSARRLLAVAALTLGSVQLGAAPSSTLPLPGKYQSFRDALGAVQGADRVPTEEKELMGAWSRRIEKAFRAEWQPTVRLFERSRARLDELAQKVEVHNDEVKLLTAKYAALDRTSQAEVAAYNARADAANARKRAYDEEKDRIMEGWRRRCDELEKWLDASEMASFVERAKRTLRTCYGEAYKQLLGIHEGTLDWEGR